jgi:murein DD-endopeptidase MepM/ murein hydrolase activator NlpD
MGLLFSALIAVNVYFFLLRGGTSLRALIHTSELGREGPQAAILGGPGVAEPGARAPASPRQETVGRDDDGILVEGVMRAGDTLEERLRKDGLSAQGTRALTSALGRALDLKTVRAGQHYAIHLDAEGHLRGLDYRIGPALAFSVEKTAGRFTASRDERPVETRIAELGGTLSGSLFDALKRSGEDPALGDRLVALFSFDVDLYAEARPGDRFKLVVEKRYRGGRFVGYGHLLAAEYQARSGTVRAFWFEPADHSIAGGYYTEHGESAERTLLKTPLKYVRGAAARRVRPILHTERAELGVDYPALPGTPVWAVAEGKVTFVGSRGGAGDVVVLAHPNGAQSSYGHLSRFARGLRVGESVRQEQVVGYVGASGLASAPHLHFGLEQGGGFVDPLKVKAERRAPLQARFRTELADEVAPLLTELAGIETGASAHLVVRAEKP